MNTPAPLSYKARTFRAIFLVVAGYFCFNIADLCSKLLQDHYTLYQVLGTSSLFERDPHEVSRTTRRRVEEVELLLTLQQQLRGPH